MSFLAIQDLAKRFGGTKALDGLSLDLAEGEVLALLGPTGAGKSTTLLCVAGLEKADRGQIALDGEDLTGLPANRRDVAMVFEGLNLFPTLSVRQNITLPLLAPDSEVTANEIESRLQTVCEQLRIAHLIERRPEGLSGGETQRVALARALVRRSALYLLDEPLSALDLKLREDLQAELRGLHAHYGSTLLYATHDFHGATAIADRLALVAKGKVIQIGRLQEIMAAPANAAVGRLIGSPHMAFLRARRQGDEIRLEGQESSLPLSAFRPAESIPEAVTIGVWPEDIALADEAGFIGSIYAVNRRGIDKAVQIDGGFGSFRKAVPLELPARQGMTAGFTFDPSRAFLFDSETEELLSQAQRESLAA